MTMPDETQRRPRILISITSTQSEKLLKKCFDALRIPIFYQCRAQGTAPSEILDILGMRESARLITVSFLPRFSVPAVFEAMENEAAASYSRCLSQASRHRSSPCSMKKQRKKSRNG